MNPGSRRDFDTMKDWADGDPAGKGKPFPSTLIH